VLLDLGWEHAERGVETKRRGWNRGLREQGEKCGGESDRKADSRLGHQTQRKVTAKRTGQLKQGPGERKSASWEEVKAQTGMAMSNAAEYPHKVDPTGLSQQPVLLSGLLLWTNCQVSAFLLDPRWFCHKYRLKPETERRRTARGIWRSVIKLQEAFFRLLQRKEGPLQNSWCSGFTSRGPKDTKQTYLTSFTA